MKNRWLSLAIMVPFVSALAIGFSCLCIAGDCHAASEVTPVKVPLCHPAATGAKTPPSSSQGCCGKCRIEKAAIPSIRVFHLPVTLSVDSSEKSHLSDEGLTSFVFFHKNAQGPPASFFVQHVLGTTFSFGAPPME